MTRTLVVALITWLLADPLPAQQASRDPTGSIVGRVVNTANGTGIEGARVEVLGAGRAVTSGSQGRYLLDSVSVGAWRVRATAIGFEPIVLADVLVGSGKPLELDLRLTPRIVEVTEIVVDAPYFQPGVESSTSTGNLSAEDVRRAPGVQEDVVRAVALLPGVAVTSGGRNDLAVRGGAPYENLFLVDGLEVPNINHFGSQGSTGGPLTILNIDFIREASFSAGGFGVQYGDRTASLASFSLREGNSERLAGEVNLSATGFGIIGEGPMGKNGTFLASVRRSYLDLVFRAADFSFIPEYWDAQLKVTQRIGARSSLSLIAVGALDNIILDEETADNRLDNSRIAAPDQQSYFTGLTWNYSLPKGLLTATLGRTWTRFSTSQYDTLLAPVYLNRSEEGDNSLKTELAWQFTPRLQVAVGNTLRIADQLDYDVLLAGEYRTDSLNQPTPLAVDTAFTALRNATYAQASLFVGGVRLTAGLRGDWYEFIDAFRVAPRLGANIPVGTSGSLNLSLGQYYQAPPFIWLVGDPGNAERLKPIRATTGIIGYERLLRPDLKGQVEVYYKRYADYAARLYRPEAVLQPAGFDDVTSDIPSGLEPLSSIGIGRSYGVELQLQKKFSTVPLYGLVSLTGARSEFAGVDGDYYTGGFETRFIGNLLAGWRFNPRWEVSGKYRLSTGLSYTPFATSGPLEGERDFTNYNASRLPTFAAIDIRVDRRWSFQSVQLDVYVDIQNLLGRANVTGTYWNARTQQEEFNEGLGLLPTIGVNVEF
ncbi:MAG TPA: TonB-dependent receptor [Gemmatimonadales bacterium]|nr:TonB-dependent receptor [Gemmatimonadales bacterium]